MRRSKLPKTYYATTRDGWRIALHRYKKKHAKGVALLCHGLGSNRFDLDAPGSSLARYLFDGGFDVWVIDLRGAGQSSRPTLFNRLRYDWNFDDYLYHDLPAALRLIHERTGTEKVHWIGHSMGGMLAYAYLALWGERSIRSVVTVGSPAFSHMRRPILDTVLKLYGLARPIRKVPNRSLARLVSFFPGPARTTWGRVVMNPRNISSRRAKTLLRVAVEDIPISLLDQFVDWYRHREFRMHYGTFDYRKALQNIKVPTMIVAGSKDWLTPPEDLEMVFDQLGSEDKEYLCVGRANGFSGEYGHIDLILGSQAQDEVFPEIYRWLSSR